MIPKDKAACISTVNCGLRSVHTLIQLYSVTVFNV